MLDDFETMRTTVRWYYSPNGDNEYNKSVPHSIDERRNLALLA